MNAENKCNCELCLPNLYLGDAGEFNRFSASEDEALRTAHEQKLEAAGLPTASLEFAA